MMEMAEEQPWTHAQNEEFLRRIRNMKERMRIKVPKVEVRFEDLTVEADVHVGGRALPTLVNATINFLQCTGKVMYNGKHQGLSTKQPLCVYVSQHDLHHAELTVRETLNFAAHMFGSNNESGLSGETTMKGKVRIDNTDIDADAATCDEGEKLLIDYVIKKLGLNECTNITIGDEMRRGISGGQKKRVTIGEMLVSLARSFFMDDISNGLDSSTTFGIIKFLSQMAHLMDITMVISLLQPPPETFELVDDIILLCEGKIVYHGPREAVLDFFERMGFKCPARKNTADFLQEVCGCPNASQGYLFRTRAPNDSTPTSKIEHKTLLLHTSL